MPPERDEVALYKIIDTLVQIDDSRCVSAAQITLAWLITSPAISSVVIGARTDEQLEDNLAASDLTLADDEIQQLEAVSSTPLLYPYWHQLQTASDRLSEADLSLVVTYKNFRIECPRSGRNF